MQQQNGGFYEKYKKHVSKHFRNNDIPFSSEEKYISYYQDVHWHDFYEIEYILSGSGEYIINGESYEIKPNTVFFSTPTDFQEIKFYTETKLINIQFTTHWVDEDVYNSLTSPVVFVDDKAEYESLLKALCKYGPKGTKFNKGVSKHMLNATLFMIASNNNKITGKKQYEINEYFHKIIVYINENFLSNITLSQIAQHVNLSPEYTSRLFKKHNNQSISEYIADLRLNYAYKLILSTKMSINDISISSGYNSTAHFIRVFKSKFNCSPNKLRKDTSK